jgi:acetyl/propionyl-CoA carboxylase alpha subunit
VWQIRVAAGEALPFEQSDLSQRGHAIECRIYAEDPANNFLPSIGKIGWYVEPQGPGVRVDAGISTNSEVTPYYDPMLAKLITYGANRPEAIAKMNRALREMVVLGVTTNIPYLLAILAEPDFVAGHTTTGFLEEKMPAWQPNNTLSDTDWLAIAVQEMMKTATPTTQATGEMETMPDPWQATDMWRNVG